MSKRKTPISPETEQLLREVLHYDPETGEFRWTRTVHSHAVKGSLAGTIGKKGYRIIQLNKRLFSGQQLAAYSSPRTGGSHSGSTKPKSRSSTSTMKITTRRWL